jgi:hypothetical protein
MKWRDIRFEKPTAADGDKVGKVLQLLCNGVVVTWPWNSLSGVVAWMPASELPDFDRVPDPPDGWRFVQAGEEFDERAKCWWGRWLTAGNVGCYAAGKAYIVPIGLVKPKYRPFANATEFAPHRERWLKNGSSCRRVDHYNELGVNGMAWESLFRNRTFEDGTPCGVKVAE